MIRADNVQFLLLLLIALGRWVIFGWVAVAIIATVGATITTPRLRHWRRAARVLWWGVACAVGFVISTTLLVEAAPLPSVPLGDLELRPPAGSGYDSITVSYRWNDALWMTGLDLEWSALFRATRAGEPAWRLYDGIHTGPVYIAIDRGQIETALREIGVDTNQPSVVTQVDQLTRFFRDLGFQGVRAEGLDTFECNARVEHYDRRVPWPAAALWLTCWAALAAAGWAKAFDFSVRRFLARFDSPPRLAAETA